MTQHGKEKKKIYIYNLIHPYIGWKATWLLNLHNSKRQSMEEGPFVRTVNEAGAASQEPPCQKCLVVVPLGHDRASRTRAKG